LNLDLNLDLTTLKKLSNLIFEFGFELRFDNFKKVVKSDSILNTTIAMSTPTLVKPFLKWAGGKSQLLEQLRTKYPPALKRGQIKSYYEPFLGGGAVFFDLIQHYPLESYYLSDLNEELILVYQVVQQEVEALIEFLRVYQHRYFSLQQEEEKKEYFYDLRNCYNQSRFNINYKKLSEPWVRRAAQMIFLNKTAYNGLFRLNQAGGFNVPFGKYKTPKILDETNLIRVSKLLQQTALQVADVNEIASQITAPANTFVYFDPPYRPISKTANFTSYHRVAFDDSAQIRLANIFKKLHRKHAHLMLSNSDPKPLNPEDTFFERHYAGFQISTVSATRMINSVAQKRGKINELVITNYDYTY